MDPKIVDYIQANRTRYTREAIREQLIAAGHDPRAVDAELESSAGQYAESTRPVGWRPRWREFLVLVVLGAIGAAFVWADETYGGGGFAVVVYVIIVSIGFGLAKVLSIAIDHGSIMTVAVLVAVLGIGATLFFAGGPSPIALLVAAPAAMLAGLLLYFRSRNPRAAGAIGAALPILVWLAITGTCYTPLLNRL